MLKSNMLWGSVYRNTAYTEQHHSPSKVMYISFNILRPQQNGSHFPDNYKYIFTRGNMWIAIKLSLKCASKGPINNIPALVQIKAWYRPMMVSLLTHIYVTRPPWVDLIKLIYVSFLSFSVYLKVWNWFIAIGNENNSIALTMCVAKTSLWLIYTWGSRGLQPMYLHELMKNATYLSFDENVI